MYVRMFCIGVFIVVVGLIVSAVFPEALYLVHLLTFGREGEP